MSKLVKRVYNNFIREIPVLGGTSLAAYRKLKTIKSNVHFKIRLLTSEYHIPDPENIYWINPQNIIYHTNFGSKKRKEDRVFDTKKDRGAVYDGDWDRATFKFEDLNVYKAIENKIKDNTPLQETEFYNVHLSRIESGEKFWECKDKDEFDQRMEYLHELIKSIREKGYIANNESRGSDSLYRWGGEVTVNIGRDGKLLFQDGRHRLAIAKILGVKKIPVQILVRHKNWQEFRERVKVMAEGTGASAKKGYLYQPLLHPDLQDIPAFHGCKDRFDVIKEDLPVFKGKLLDIGANLGYFSFKFQDSGFECTAVENNSDNTEVVEKLKAANESELVLIKNNILDEEVIDNLASHHFDVVLALNIFHHFLKRKESYESLKVLLERLNIGIMYFEPHSKEEDQMKDAYVNYSEEDFIDFIFSHTKLKNKKKIYRAKDGRNLYRLD